MWDGSVDVYSEAHVESQQSEINEVREELLAWKEMYNNLQKAYDILTDRHTDLVNKHLRMARVQLDKKIKHVL